MFTYMTIAECNRTLQERLKSSRQLEGWVDKNGTFSLTVSSRVARVFSRRTRLQGDLKRDKGITTINGYVPDGVAPRQRAIIMIGMVLAGFFLIVSGNGLPGIIAIIVAPIFLIPLAGDYANSEALLKEVRRSLHAREGTPPKPAARKPPQSKPATSHFPTNRSTTTSPTRKPTSSASTTAPTRKSSSSSSPRR
jgi:hypothetical protein